MMQTLKNRSDIVYVIWFLILCFSVYFSHWWLLLSLSWRILSFMLLLAATGLLIVNSNLKAFGRIRAIGADKAKIEENKSEMEIITKLVEEEVGSRRSYFIIGAVIVAYLVAAISACLIIKSTNQFYLYIVGWALVCLVIDYQIRFHFMCKSLKKILSAKQS